MVHMDGRETNQNQIVTLLLLLQLFSHAYTIRHEQSRAERALAMRTSTRVFIVLLLVWLVAGAIMSFSMTPDMALGFKQRYKVDPYQVHQIVGACTAAMGVLVHVPMLNDYLHGHTIPEAGRLGIIPSAPQMQQIPLGVIPKGVRDRHPDPKRRDLLEAERVKGYQYPLHPPPTPSAPPFR
jgi:hypothetical protein